MVFRTYRIKNIRTGEYLPGTYRKAEVLQICGRKFEPSAYANARTTVAGKWLVEYADEAYYDNEGWESKWAKEWDEIRMRFLKAGRLA